MLRLKQLLEDSFAEKPITFNQAIDEVNRQFEYGIYTNSIVVDIMRRINLPIESVSNFILPGRKSRFLTLGDNMAKMN